MMGTDTKEHVQKANTHVKSCLPSLAIKKMQITTTTRCHRTPTNTAATKTPTTRSAGEGGATRTLTHRGRREMGQWGGHSRELLVDSNTVKRALTMSASNPLVGIYSKERKRMSTELIAALFISPQTGNLPSGPQLVSGEGGTAGRRRGEHRLARHLDWVSEAPHRARGRPEWFHLYDSPGKTNLQRWRQGQRCQGLWARGGHDCGETPGGAWAESRLGPGCRSHHARLHVGRNSGLHAPKSRLYSAFI